MEEEALALALVANRKALASAGPKYLKRALAAAVYALELCDRQLRLRGQRGLNAIQKLSRPSARPLQRDDLALSEYRRLR